MKSKLRSSQNTQTVRKVTRIQREEIEDELRKSPDFQLYMLTAVRHDRERMERLLEKLPAFRMWRRLSHVSTPLRNSYRQRIKIARKKLPADGRTDPTASDSL
jgi:hypothetical protein